MNAVPSSIRGGDGRITFPLRIDTNQKPMGANHDFSWLKSVSEDTLQLHIQAFPDHLEEYFRSVADGLKENMDAIVSGIKGIDWTDKQSIMDGLQPILDFLKPIFDYVKAHPWILIPLLIPAVELFIGLLGFGAEGIVAGSPAALLHSVIGNVAKDSLFAFLQSVGAGGWGRGAMRRTNKFVTIAVIIAAIGEFLINHGIVDLDAAKKSMEGMWNREVNHLDPPPARGAGNQVMALSFDSGLVRYCLLAWALMYGAVCVAEGGAF